MSPDINNYLRTTANVNKGTSFSFSSMFSSVSENTPKSAMVPIKINHINEAEVHTALAPLLLYLNNNLEATSDWMFLNVFQNILKFIWLRVVENVSYLVVPEKSLLSRTAETTAAVTAVAASIARKNNVVAPTAMPTEDLEVLTEQQCQIFELSMEVGEK